MFLANLTNSMHSPSEDVQEILYRPTVTLPDEYTITPNSELELYCINRIKPIGLFRPVAFQNKDQLVQKVEHDYLETSFEQLFTKKEIVTLHRIFLQDFKVHIKLQAVMYPIEFYTPFRDYFEELYEFYYFEELNEYNLGFEVVGVGELL